MNKCIGSIYRRKNDLFKTKPFWRFFKYRCSSSSNNDSNGKSNDDSRPMVFPEETLTIDDPPTTCCMSGCANCVYIAWAEALTKKMAQADPAIAKTILEKVSDPGMKAFLRMELKSRGLM